MINPIGKNPELSFLFSNVKIAVNNSYILAEENGILKYVYSILQNYFKLLNSQKS